MHVIDNKALGESIEKLAQGDVNALESIAKEAESVLMTVGTYYYGNRADAEDAVHDLYVTLCHKAACFKRNENARAWLVKVFENSIKSKFRQIKRERNYLKQEISRLKSDIQDDKHRDNHSFLQELFEKLTDEERKMVIYYYWCGCTVRETAKILHIPRSTFFSKLKKVEEKVKKIENISDK